MSELNLKTVFVLDHCKPMKELTEKQIEIESSSRTKSHSSFAYLQFIPPVIKTLWSCVVENTLEYCRIVWDIYSEERLLMFINCNPQSVESLNTWALSQQNLHFLSEALALSSGPINQHGTVHLGIKSAIESLSEPTIYQTELMNANKSSSFKALNKGRIICITSCITDSDLEDFFLTTLHQHNRFAASHDHLIPIHECEFILLSIHPIGKEHLSRVCVTPMREISPTVRSEVYVTNPDDLHNKMVKMCIDHHNLVITNVNNIPMKEEQNSSSSSNYDVPLYHPRIPNSETDRLTLRWSSPVIPKSSLGTLNPCNIAFRVTPVDINSRPTTCLCNFVINGRCVWLETVDKFTKKASVNQSHVLTSHGGEIWMHLLETARNILEDPPSLSEGIGGRITDYRIIDFQDFMKLNMIIPYPESSMKVKQEKSRRLSIEDHTAGKEAKKPIELAKNRLWKKSSFWLNHLTIGDSLLFSMSVHIDPILKLMPKDSLSEAQKCECDQSLWNLMAYEARGDFPPLPSSQHKKHKKDEQWKLVYDELEVFLKANQYSENHRKVLECFLESRQSGKDTKSFIRDEKLVKDNKDKNSLLEGLSKQVASLKKPQPIIPDSPMSPTPSTPRNSFSQDEDDEVVESKKTSLLELWTNKTAKKDFRTLTTGRKLYIHLEEKLASNSNGK